MFRADKIARHKHYRTERPVGILRIQTEKKKQKKKNTQIFVGSRSKSFQI
jgi:hypothetical protein